jgi:hypothetical protein
MTPHDDRRRRVEDACADLILTGQPVTFDAVADRAELGRATLYRNSELRAVIEEHRARGREAHTLSGLAGEIAHLRTAVETLAATVRRHDDELRQLRQSKPPRR